MNLPTMIYRQDSEDSVAEEEPVEASGSRYLDEALDRMAALQRRLAHLEKGPLGDAGAEELELLRKNAAELHERLFESGGSRDLLLAERGYDIVQLGPESRMHLQHDANRRLSMQVGGRSDVYVATEAGDNYVSLRGSQPMGAALQPGNASVWAIVLGTKRNLFFLPAASKINVTVLSALEPPGAGETDDKSPIYSNTIPTTVTIRTSLWFEDLTRINSATGGP